MLWINWLWLYVGFLVLWASGACQAQVCGKSRVIKSPGVISEVSTDRANGQNHCDVYISAPKHNFIVLNLTEIYGFQSATMETKTVPYNSTVLPSKQCVPRLDIAEVAKPGDYKIMKRICGGRDYKPRLYRSRGQAVKLVYSWRVGDSSRLTVMVSFHPQPKHCRLNMTFECKSGERCLFHKLVCDGVSHCADSSDEANCPNSPTAQSPDATGDLIQAIVIAVVILFTLGMVVCVACHCRGGQRTWTARPGEGSSAEHHHLNPSSPLPSSEVVYVPGSSHTSSSDREPMALPPVQRDRRHPLQQDLTLNLPPSIPISLDGEEGYSRYSQCLLKCDVSNESVRPPPNRTIFDREPPPPYRSNSAGLLDSYSDCSRSSDYRNPYRDCGSSQYIMPSCQVSENNNTRNTAHWNSGLYSSVTGAVIPDPLPGLPFQHQDASQARADRNGPPSILAVPTSGHGLSSPNASTTLATVPLLPSYNMVVGQTNRETES